MIPVEQEKEEFILDDVVETYNIIPGSGELSFEEFVHFDDNTVVARDLIDEEILAEVNEDESPDAGLNNDDEIEDVPTKIITKSKVGSLRHAQLLSVVE